MKAEFENWIDEVYPLDKSVSVEHEKNQIQLTRRVGAREAYEWCMERNSALRNEFQSLLKQHDRTVDQMNHYKKQLDQQAKVIAELKGALNFYAKWPTDGANARLALTKVKEMEKSE